LAGDDGCCNQGKRIKEKAMVATILSQTGQPIAIPLDELAPWAIFGGLLMFMVIYFVGAEQGATSIFPGMYIHEFVHDGRHVIGFPCH
jgi:hypothetical protein